MIVSIVVTTFGCVKLSCWFPIQRVFLHAVWNSLWWSFA